MRRSHHRAVGIAQQHGQAIGGEHRTHHDAAATTVVPCTWRSHKGSVGNRRASCRRRRFSSTCSGSSPTWVARLSEVYNPLLAPPRRVVVQARTVNGAGHSGTSQPSGATTTTETNNDTQKHQ